jgi:hypothetical protein
MPSYIVIRTIDTRSIMAHSLEYSFYAVHPGHCHVNNDKVGLQRSRFFDGVYDINGLATILRPNWLSRPSRVTLRKVSTYKVGLNRRSWDTQRFATSCFFRNRLLVETNGENLRLRSGPDWSKSQVSPQLQDAWVICARDLAKRSANVLGIVVEVVEFRVVEDIERICHRKMRTGNDSSTLIVNNSGNASSCVLTRRDRPAERGQYCQEC